MALAMLTLVVCALVIRNDAIQQHEMANRKQKTEAQSATEHAEFAIGDHAEKNLMRRVPRNNQEILSSMSQVKSSVKFNSAHADKDVTMSGQKASAKLMMRRIENDKQNMLISNPQTCEEWWDHHRSTNGHARQAHHGCPRGEMRKPGAGPDSIELENGDLYNTEHEKAEAICCESESDGDGLTCEHFWHHHHGNHGHSQHSENHGCPEGETRNLSAANTTIRFTADESDEVEDHQCCEEISTCKHWWTHHEGHGHGNHGCPRGETRKVDAEDFLIAPHVTDPEFDTMCCEQIATCEEWWSHHSGHGHEHHGCPAGETKKLSAEGVDVTSDVDETEEQENLRIEGLCCHGATDGGLTCEHFWHHHHGNHGHSQHSNNHGCPAGETRKLSAANTTITADEIAEEEEGETHTCCEDIATCQHWWSHHSGHGHAHHGCPAGEMRNYSAGDDSIEPENGDYATEHEKAEAICCESESDGLTCEHFWHHHHGNHGHSHHSNNHGCPEGEQQNITAADITITADEIEEEEEGETHTCCEDIPTR